MDINQIVNARAKGAAAAAAVSHGTALDLHPLHSISHANNSIPMSDTGSERANSPHDSEHSRYSAPRYAGQMNGLNGVPTLRYPSPTAMQTSLPMVQQHQQLPQPPSQPQPQAYRADGLDHGMGSQKSNIARPSDGAAQKSFPCSSCGKGFARRSDLARHERIHSGVRPHVCEHPNCGKQFIQRSALTVHMRVHTGEKPHMCERCGKPFSDSSSLARHRRIHSGKRPYKCPYADCQKTFTRRTTLTRHQNHHTGTVEEAAAATAAALASRVGGSNRGGRVRSDGEQYSNNGSPISTPSPGQRRLSASPNSELAPLNTMHRQPGDFQYLNNSSLPNHLRGEYNNIHPQASPDGLQQQQQQPPPPPQPQRPTSHPSGYGPPPTLEPPTNHSSDRQQIGSATGSPHLSSAGWQSPSQAIPSPSASNGYVYPDPDPYGSSSMAHQQLFYPNSNLRRPGSSEPDSYELKPRISEMWTAAQ